MDKWVYISKRIVEEVVREHEARRPYEFLEPTFGIPGGSNFKINSRSPDYSNVFDLAMRTNEILSNKIKRLNDNSIKSGDYILAQMQVHPVQFSVWRHWQRNDTIDVAAFIGIERFEWGRAYVGLVGSAHNWQLDTSTVRSTGRTASDAHGLYELIGKALEDERGEGFDEVVSRDIAARGSGERWRFSRAAHAFMGAAVSSPRRKYEMLFLAHDVGFDVDMDVYESDGRKAGNFHSVILGAPIWIKETVDVETWQKAGDVSPYRATGAHAMWSKQIINPTTWYGVRRTVPLDAPRVIWEVPPDTHRTENWRRFDVYSESMAKSLGDTKSDRDLKEWGVDVLCVHTLSPVSNSHIWREFCRWFADQAARYGPLPIEFAVHPKRQILWWKYDADKYVASGRFGWLLTTLIDDGSCEEFIVLTDGLVYSANMYGWSDDAGAPIPISMLSSAPYMRAMLFQTALWRLGPFE